MDYAIVLSIISIFSLTIVDANEYAIPVTYTDYNGILIKFDRMGRNTQLDQPLEYHDVTEMNEAKLRTIFKSEEPETGHFIPRVTPEECQSETFCEDPHYYPYSQVNTKLSEAGEQYKYIFGVDEEDELTERMGTPMNGEVWNVEEEDISLVPRNMSPVAKRVVTTHSICQSRMKIIFPRIAKNKRDQWKYVVNQGVGKVQGIAVEECHELGANCDYIAGKHPSFIPTCEQKFSYRRLLSLSYDGSLQSDIFRFPVACICVVKSYVFHL